jgi:hypothetical protein
MIVRIWKGAVRRDDGDAYARYLRATAIAGYARTPGNRAALMLRREVGDRCQFVMSHLVGLDAGRRRVRRTRAPAGRLLPARRPLPDRP